VKQLKFEFKTFMKLEHLPELITAWDEITRPISSPASISIIAKIMSGTIFLILFAQR